MRRTDDDGRPAVRRRRGEIGKTGRHLVHEIASKDQVVARITRKVHFGRDDDFGPDRRGVAPGIEEARDIRINIAEMRIQLRKRDGDNICH